MTGQMMPDRPSRPFRIPKKIAMINDIAGYGRCSTTVSLPLISAMQVQVCPVPTSIFSNHTGFPVHFMHDCTDILPEYLEKWRELELTFDGIYCGFLGSVTQIGIVKDFLASQTGNAGHSRISADGNRPIVILDPVMGDHGRAYRTITPQHCEEMKELLTMADIITPQHHGGLPSHRRCIPGIRMDCRRAERAYGEAPLHGAGQNRDNRHAGRR